MKLDIWGFIKPLANIELNKYKPALVMNLTQLVNKIQGQNIEEFISALSVGLTPMLTKVIGRDALASFLLPALVLSLTRAADDISASTIDNWKSQYLTRAVHSIETMKL